jgi:hypothetical protein
MSVSCECCLLTGVDPPDHAPIETSLKLNTILISANWIYFAPQVNNLEGTCTIVPLERANDQNSFVVCYLLIEKILNLRSNSERFCTISEI